MDIGDITVSFPTLDKINAFISAKIEKDVNERLTQILISISEQEQLSREKLFNQYLNTDCLNSTKCVAIIGKGRQCTRKKKNGNYCVSHTPSDV